MIIVPTYLSRPLYPGGGPVPADAIALEEGTLGQLYGRYRRQQRITLLEERMLRDYVLYYIQAPIFDSPLTRELRGRNTETLTLPQLLHTCSSYGLDPF